MAEDKEQHQPRDETDARTETSPEPPETSPRGNVQGKPDRAPDMPTPPPLPH